MYSKVMSDYFEDHQTIEYVVWNKFVQISTNIILVIILRYTSLNPLSYKKKTNILITPEVA